MWHVYVIAWAIYSNVTINREGTRSKGKAQHVFARRI